MEENGFLYVLFEKEDSDFKQHHEWFLKSYKSLLNHVPNAKVFLYTNKDIPESDLFYKYIFDKNHRAMNLSVADGLLLSPFRKTIYLDNDIIIERPIITGVFKFLKEYSFAGVYANWWGEGTLYPDFHGGVMGANTENPVTRNIIKEWIEISENDLHWSNQKTLRRLMRRYRKEFCILPSYLVFRWHHVRSLVDYAIVTHGHEMDKAKITKKVIQSLEDSLSDL